jgi:alkaline phosphatase
MTESHASTSGAAGRRLSAGRRRLSAILAALALAAIVVAVMADDADAKRSRPGQPVERVKNVIVMISDGMGYNHVAATDYYQYGATGTQVYEGFPVRTGMSTYSYYGSYDPLRAWGLFTYLMTAPTDSASAATAMSTGVKTYDSGIGVDIDRQPLYHVMQDAEGRGKATGVVTTVEWSHATPAGFVAHNVSRNDYEGIAREMIGVSATDVIMGAGNPLFDDDGLPKATPGYKYVGGVGTWNALVAGSAGGDADADGDADPWTLIQSKEDFEALALADETPARVCGTAQVYTTLQQSRGGDRMASPGIVPLNDNVPDLQTMTVGALNVLDGDEDGFMLMVEGGAVDWASHANQPGRLIEEQIDFNDAVAAVVAWVEENSNWGETLVIVTGDHETGYMWGPGTGASADGTGVWMPVVNEGVDVLPGMQFNSGDHTNSLIPFYAKGSAARHLRECATGVDPMRGAYLDNTDIADVIFKTMR